MTSHQVRLVRWTPDALGILLRTKNTRLGNSGDDPALWPADKQREHLAYMRDTIKSSWEFVDYTFEISGVTRAFTHQLVRTRAGAYAQESQRTVDVSGNGVLMPDRVLKDEEARAMWDHAVATVHTAYVAMLERGIPAGDARGILPTNVLTSITCKFNLRTLSEMAKVRLCTRTQGEYQSVFRAMRAAVLEQHPWAAEFIEVACIADGRCAFPRYGRKECPMYDAAMEPAAGMTDQRRARFELVRHEATPIARAGKAA